MYFVVSRSGVWMFGPEDGDVDYEAEVCSLAEEFPELIYFEAELSPTDQMYSITREGLAGMIAAHTSGIEGAQPEPADFDIAERVIRVIDQMIDEVVLT